MEIYHRDHWIIIVHMTTSNDLTIWNEENTIIDWINHLGRIVKHVFSKPSRLRREGRGPFYGPVVHYGQLCWNGPKKMNGQYIGMESIIGPYFDSFSGGSYFRKANWPPWHRCWGKSYWEKIGLEFVEKKKISKKSWSDHGNEVVWEVGQEGKMRMSHKGAPLHPLRAPMTTHLCTFSESGATFSESHHYWPKFISISN